MREHPVIGERILRPLPGLDAVATAVRHEHERWDGGGYPDGLAGEAIPLASRIVLACDACHALVTDRPYRAALDAPSRARRARALRRHPVRPGASSRRCSLPGRPATCDRERARRRGRGVAAALTAGRRRRAPPAPGARAASR